MTGGVAARHPAGDRVLDNPRADRVRAVAALASPSVRRRRRRYLVEGPRGVLDLLAAAPDAATVVESVYAADEALGRHPDLVDAAARAGVPLTRATPPVVAAMSDAATPQGVVAVARLPAPTTVADIPDLGSAGFAALLVEVRDPGNVGTVMRAADAAGATAVVLTTASADPYSPKAVRASAGSLFHVPVLPGLALDDVVAHARDLGVALVATSADGEVDLDDAAAAARSGTGPLAGPHVWMLGNEAHGLTDAARDAAVATVRIALPGRAESLNLAMAATLVLFASAGSRRAD